MAWGINRLLTALSCVRVYEPMLEPGPKIKIRGAAPNWPQNFPRTAYLLVSRVPSFAPTYFDR